MTHQKIVHKQHTGKVVHHRHTSYGSLLLIVLLTAVPLVLASRTVAIAAADPVEGSEGVYAVVAAPVPDTAPVITTPSVGSVYRENEPIQVSGTCPPNTLLKVYKNNVFAGATFCESGRFSVRIGLFIGINTLTVRPFSINNESGPDSQAVAVRYELPEGVQNTAVSTAEQFFMTSDVQYKGVKVGEPLSWPITLVGGLAPYAINVAWGDSHVDLISRATKEAFSIQHTYEQPGSSDRSSYNVTITATDQAGNKSFMQLVTIVSGEKTNLVASVKQGYDISGYLQLAWQLTAAVILVVISFWLGERREIRIIRKQTKTA